MLLKEDKSIDADLVRAEIFWTDRNWSDASESLRNMLRNSEVKPGKKLNNEQAITVLNLATAYTLSDNERALVRLRRDFGMPMAKTSFADAFELVAAPLTLGLISPESVAKRVKVVTNFRSFMDKYKDEVKSGKLSSLTRVGKSFGEPVLISDEG